MGGRIGEGTGPSPVRGLRVQSRGLGDLGSANLPSISSPPVIGTPQGAPGGLPLRGTGDEYLLAGKPKAVLSVCTDYVIHTLLH